MNSSLTDDEIRDRFSAYHDGDLPPEETALVRKRLEEDKALGAEYERFRRMLGSLGALAVDGDGPSDHSKDPHKPGHTPEAEPTVDLLSGVQNKLYKRSGGKFYNNRWSRTVGVVPLEFFALVVLLLLLFAWFGLTQVTGVRPAQPTQPNAPMQPAPHVG